MELSRKLKATHATLIALGGMIGSTYFLGTGYIFQQVGPLTFLVFILGGWLAYLTMQCQAELSAHGKPSHLSLVSYAKEHISPEWACGVGWAYWANWVVYIAAECLAGGILMEDLAPQLSVGLWATLFAFCITGVNLLRMEFFGKATAWLTWSQLSLLLGFCLLALLILFGWVGSGPPSVPVPQTWDSAFPQGLLAFFFCMVILLNNYQGAEMIALSASEVENAQHSIPRALQKISHRAMFLLSFPLLLLALIFPWQQANLSDSVFVEVLHHYGFMGLAQVFTFVIVVVAFSSANSSLYATVRTLHALSVLQMAPKGLQQLNKNRVPGRATLATAAAMWLLVLLSYFFPTHEYYINLLALSGFTGTICWISICWSQLRFRRSLSPQAQSQLLYKVSWFPYLTQLAIWLQVFCLGVILYSPDLRTSFYFGLPCLLVPMVAYRCLKKI